jgi:hypothetical protein
LLPLAITCKGATLITNFQLEKSQLLSTIGKNPEHTGELAGASSGDHFVEKLAALGLS